MAQFKLDALLPQAEKIAKEALTDLEEVGGEVSMLAKRALALQLVAATQKMLGANTAFLEKSVAAAYHNLVVASSAATARKVQGLFATIATVAVDAIWSAAGLPEIPEQPTLDFED